MMRTVIGLSVQTETSFRSLVARLRANQPMARAATKSFVRSSVPVSLSHVRRPRGTRKNSHSAAHSRRRASTNASRPASQRTIAAVGEKVKTIP